MIFRQRQGRWCIELLYRPGLEHAQAVPVSRAEIMDTVTVNRRRLLVLSATATLALSSRPASSQSADETIVPFTYHAEDAALLDLKRRLDGTRWPEHETAEGWEQGPPLSAMQEFIAHWRST